MVYPHKWSPVSCRSSTVQGKFAGRRPTFYHWAMQATSDWLWFVKGTTSMSVLDLYNNLKWTQESGVWQAKQHKQKTNFKQCVESAPTTPPLPLLRYFHAVMILLHDSLKFTKKLLTLHKHPTHRQHASKSRDARSDLGIECTAMFLYTAMPI